MQVLQNFFLSIVNIGYMNAKLNLYNIILCGPSNFNKLPPRSSKISSLCNFATSLLKMFKARAYLELDVDVSLRFLPR